MVIKLKANHGYYLIVKADNVNIEEDIETREYFKTKDGKTDYSVPPKRDVSSDFLTQIEIVMNDAIYYRKSEYDSSQLIEALFEKLPKDIAIELAENLYNSYQKEVE